MEENRHLQSQVREQQQVIESMRGQMDDFAKSSARHERELDELRTQLNAPTETEKTTSAFSAGQQIRLSGEAEIGIYRSGSAGAFTTSTFRVDDAKLFVEAPVWENVYFYSAIDLTTREESGVELGELYVDFEDVASAWIPDRLLNVRVGLEWIPFGEEYLARTGVDNPLISHSLADVWGQDTGVVIYGGAKAFRYSFGIQTGGPKAPQAQDLSKAFTGKLDYDPTRWLHFSASGLSTGNLAAANGGLSVLWFGNGFFRSIGSSSTRRFHANLLEFDAAMHWKTGQVRGDVGGAWYGDDDIAGNNARHLTYYTVEGVQDLTENLYGAARYSVVRAPKGYPLVGQGNFGNFFFRGPMTENLWRLSLGLGYRIGPPLVLKFEYSFEGGKLVNGVRRDDEDLVSSEVGLKF